MRQRPGFSRRSNKLLLPSSGEEQLALFPESIVKTLQKTWQSSATCIYRNWLNSVLTKKAEVSQFADDHRWVRSSSAKTVCGIVATKSSRNSCHNECSRISSRETSL